MKGVGGQGQCLSKVLGLKVQAVLYTFVLNKVPFREDNYPEPSAFGVRWPVPVLAAFISQLLPSGTNLLLSEQ